MENKNTQANEKNNEHASSSLRAQRIAQHHLESG